MALLRLGLLAFVILTVVYVLVSVYSRSVRREKLEKRWDAEPPQGADADARDAYIQEGMRAYDHGRRRKLIILVYIVPLVAILVINYFINVQ